MTQVAPLVFADNIFALKGGTAINLFMRDMPRLSVDLDLVFPDYTLPRARALERITAALRQSAERLKSQGFQTQTVPAMDTSETKLLVRRGNVEAGDAPGGPRNLPHAPVMGQNRQANEMLEEAANEICATSLQVTLAWLLRGRAS
jgi:hypothetical protein